MRCPQCDYARLKSWEELNDEEKFLRARLPASAVFTIEERKKHLFCPRCGREEAPELRAQC